MLHAREDYAPIQDPRSEPNRIPDDEPVFLLRAQDCTAAATVRHWASLQSDPLNNNLSQAAIKQAEAMEAWPKKGKADGPHPLSSTDDDDADDDE
jgi:hypothetical protein